MLMVEPVMKPPFSEVRKATPGDFLGEDLVKRLEEHAELTFAVEA